MQRFQCRTGLFKIVVLRETKNNKCTKTKTPRLIPIEIRPTQGAVWGPVGVKTKGHSCQRAPSAIALAIAKGDDPFDKGDRWARARGSSTNPSWARAKGTRAKEPPHWGVHSPNGASPLGSMYFPMGTPHRGVHVLLFVVVFVPSGGFLLPQ
jgi:hypothetical protein